MDLEVEKQIDAAMGGAPATAEAGGMDADDLAKMDAAFTPEGPGILSKVAGVWKTAATAPLVAAAAPYVIAHEEANRALTGQAELDAARQRKQEAEDAAIEATAKRYEDAGDPRRAANIRLGLKAAQRGLAAKAESVAGARNALLAVPEVPFFAAAPAAMVGLMGAGAVKGALQGLGEEETAGGVARRALEGGLAASPTAATVKTGLTGHEPRAGSLAKAAGIKDPVLGLLADLATDLIGAGAFEQAYKVLSAPKTFTPVDVARLRAEYDDILRPPKAETGAFDELAARSAGADRQAMEERAAAGPAPDKIGTELDREVAKRKALDLEVQGAEPPPISWQTPPPIPAKPTDKIPDPTWREGMPEPKAEPVLEPAPVVPRETPLAPVERPPAPTQTLPATVAEGGDVPKRTVTTEELAKIMDDSAGPGSASRQQTHTEADLVGSIPETGSMRNVAEAYGITEWEKVRVDPRKVNLGMDNFKGMGWEKEYAQLPADTMPAVVLRDKNGQLVKLDGAHRILSAIKRGDKTIEAWVPKGTTAEGIAKRADLPVEQPPRTQTLPATPAPSPATAMWAKVGKEASTPPTPPAPKKPYAKPVINIPGEEVEVAGENLYEAIKRYVREELRGIKAYKGGYESEEYLSIPLSSRSRKGTVLDQAAEQVNSQFGTDLYADDLREILKGKTLTKVEKRQAAIEQGRQENLRRRRELLPDYGGLSEDTLDAMFAGRETPDAVVAQRVSDIVSSERGGMNPAAIVKNVKAMGPGEILPAARKIADFTKETLLGVVKALAPSTLVKSKYLDILYRAKAGIAQKVYDFDVAVHEAGKYFDHFSTDRSVKFIDNIKTGNYAAMTAEELQYARMHRVLSDNNFAMLRENPDVRGYLQNHLRVRYKPGPALDKFIEAKLSNLKGPETFKHEQVFDTLAEAKAWGLEPTTVNPFRLLVMERADIAKSLAMQKSWKEMLKAGGMIEVTGVTKIPEGYKILSQSKAHSLGLPEIKFKPAPGETIAEALEARSINAASDIPPHLVADLAKRERMLWHLENDVKGFAVEENTLRLYKNWASKDWIRSVAAGRGLVAIKNAYTMAELSFNLFHMMFVTSDTVSAEMGMALRKAVNLPLSESLSGRKNPQSIFNIMSPRGVYKEGRTIEEALQGQAMRHAFSPDDLVKYQKEIVGDKWKKWSDAERAAYLDKMGSPHVSPEQMRLVNLLFESGLEPHGQGLGFQMDSMSKLNQAMADNKRLTALIHVAPAGMQKAMSPLFNVYIPRLKLGLAQRELALSLAENEMRLAKGMVTERELARSVVSFVEDRLGELAYPNLWWDKTLKTALQTVFRSVTWNLGDIRAMPGGVFEQAKEMHLYLNDASRGLHLSPKMSWMVAMTAQTMAMGAATQFILTGIWPESLKDYLYPRTDANDPTQRAGMMTYAKEVIHAVSSPGKFTSGKLAGVWGKAYEALYSNKDFYGNAVVSKSDSALMGLVKRFVHMAPLPISVSSAYRSHQLGEDPSRMLMGPLGLPKAGADVSRSPMQKVIAEYSYGQHPTAPKEKEAAEETATMRRLRKALTDDPERGRTEVAIALEDQKIAPADAQWLFKQKTHDIWAYYFGKMTAKEALDALEKGSEEEKKMFIQPMIKKYQNQRKRGGFTQREAEEYKSRIEAILTETQ